MTFDELKLSIKKQLSGYDDLTDAEKTALLSKREYATPPQPVDYGLTFDDLNLYNTYRSWSCRLDDGKVIDCVGTRPGDKYKKGKRWFRVLYTWEARSHVVGGLAFFALLFGGLATSGKDSRLLGLILLGFGLACIVCAILPGVLLKRLRRRASPALEAYWQALRLHDQYNAAVHDAEEAALLKKRSYWAYLDGYEFERATADVLKRHQFNPRVTKGSADGGVDIEVTRGGHKGVVQCKAHVAYVGPHVVRDLYGVIHHSGADFGIIVSRGGFSKGAVDFARDKPILFVDISDLIAMQEGRDVLAGAFTRKEIDQAASQT
jgi:hypothetical protein